MPSRLAQIKAHDFRPTGGTAELWEEVIRRIGGQADRTEPVLAVVEFDTDGGGMVADQNGKMIEILGRLEVAADQDVLDSDAWVINGSVYRASGVPTSFDGATKTINLVQRIPKVTSGLRTRSNR